MTSGGENGGKQNMATIWRRTVSIVAKNGGKILHHPSITITFNSPPW